jgi:hypothetical protein
VICKAATSGEEPREHILPESLGNAEHVLRRGLVCGKCNNYFASKVEKPFLELQEIVTLRFEQILPSKRGRVPSLPGMLCGAMAPIELMRDAKTGELSVCFSEEAMRGVMTFERGQIIVPRSVPLTPGKIVSRFVGKVALEALAYLVQHDDVLLAEITDNRQLDLLRRHARFGELDNWPVSVRQVYDADDVWTDGTEVMYQIVHEFDFLTLDNGEIYFILALFGQELVINLGGPCLDGWEAWLGKNHAFSPLHISPRAGQEVKL